ARRSAGLSRGARRAARRLRLRGARDDADRLREPDARVSPRWPPPGRRPGWLNRPPLPPSACPVLHPAAPVPALRPPHVDAVILHDGRASAAPRRRPPHPHSRPSAVVRDRLRVGLPIAADVPDFLGRPPGSETHRFLLIVVARIPVITLLFHSSQRIQGCS